MDFSSVPTLRCWRTEAGWPRNRAFPVGDRKETVRINAHIRLVEREIEIEVKI